MKKILPLILVLCFMLSLGSGVLAADITTRQAELYYREIKLFLDGWEIVPTDADGKSTEPFIIDGTTYLPLRALASALGLEVAWDGKTNTVSLTSGGEANFGSGESIGTKRIVSATPGYRDIKIKLDGKTLSLRDAAGKTVEPFLLGGTTYVPVRAVASALGLEVDWNAAGSCVVLSSGRAWLPETISRTTTSGGGTAEESFEYEYNADGSPKSIKCNTRTGSYTVTLGYDSAGRLVSISAGVNKWGLERTYDEKGRISYEKSWEGSDYKITRTGYTDGGLVSTLSETVRQNGKTTKSETSYSYDRDGRVLSESFKNGGDGYTTEYTYDKNGRLLSESTFDGKHSMKTVYSYNSRELLTGIEYYDCGKLYASEGYSYDTKGLCLSESHSYGDFESRTVYTYDDRARLLTESYSDSDGVFRSTENEYDEYGNVCAQSGRDSEKGSDYSFSIRSEYSAGGLLISRSRTDSNGSSSGYSGTYDALGRLVYSETTVGNNSLVYTASYGQGLWPEYMTDFAYGNLTSIRVEYKVFETSRWTETLEEIHELMEAHAG